MNKIQAWLRGIPEINAGSARLIVFMILPMYIVYLYAIGASVHSQIHKKKPVWSAMMALLFVLSLSAFFLLLLPPHQAHQLTRTLSNYFLPTLLSCFFYCIGVLTKATVNFERQQHPETHHGITGYLDFVRRFIILSLSPFTVWLFQKTANSYAKRRPAA